MNNQQSEIQNSKIQVSVLETESAKLKNQNMTQKIEMERLTKDFMLKEREYNERITTLTVRLEEEEAENDMKSKKMNEMEDAMATLNEKIAELEARKRSDEQLRRKLHNAIQELKGMCRHIHAPTHPRARSTHPPPPNGYTYIYCISVSISISIYLSIFLSIYPSISLSLYLSISLSLSLSIYF
tara:strand:- start:156 stop:707 length:552 start_codon:yes stop_codon:yes gene_type:complete